MSTTTTASVNDSHTHQSFSSQSSTGSCPTNNNGANDKHRLPSQPVNGRFAMLPPQPIVPPPPPPIFLEKCYDSFEISKPFPQNSPIGPSNNARVTFDVSPITASARDISSIGVQAIYEAHNINDNSHRASLNFNTSNKQQSMQAPLTSYATQSNNNLVQTFHNRKQSPKSIVQRSPTSSLDSSNSIPFMPMNVKGMLLHGLSSEEVMRNWLQSLSCEELIKNFIDHGYDIHLVTRMTPQDLAAVGCKCPALRKKLLTEIRKLNLDYDLPDYKPMILEQWLDTLKLKSYYTSFVSEGYDTVEKACQLTWEDLEEIGISKLGHQKRLLLGIEKVQKSLGIQEDRQNDSAIYDVHPNHRISLNGANLEGKLNTLGRVRSGFFQTRSGANLDHRGLPVATVTPALKHISSPIIVSDKNTQPMETMRITNPGDREHNQIESLKMSDLATTLKRNPPPLPPIRTNSLKFTDSTNEQPIYDKSYGALSTQPNATPAQPAASNSTSFLPTSGSSISESPQRQSTIMMTGNNSIIPIREAPLPPHLQDRLPVPEKIEEKLSDVRIVQQNGHISSHGNEYGVSSRQISDGDEFPPPPP